MSTHVAPAFSSASRGLVISICSKPSVTRIATRFPLSSFAMRNLLRGEVQSAGTRPLLDEREDLRELVRAGDAEELEQRHLRRAQPRAVVRHPLQRDGLVLRGAGRDRKSVV